MNEWFFKLVPIGDYAPEEDEFANLYIERDGPRGLFLAVARSVIPGRELLIACAPPTIMLDLLGYEPGPADALPKAAVFLIGNQDDFTEHFVFDVKV